MDERPPRRAVALEPDRARRVRPRDEVVEHDVEAQARRGSVDRRVAHEDRREAVACELAHAPPQPRPSTQRTASAVGAAASRRARRLPRTAPYMSTTTQRRTTTPASFAARASATVPSRLISYVQDELRSPSGSFERAARWTTASKPVEIGGRHVADIEGERRLELGARPEVAAAIEERVEADDVVTRVAQHRREHRADVPVMPCDEDLTASQLPHGADVQVGDLGAVRKGQRGERHRHDDRPDPGAPPARRRVPRRHVPLLHRRRGSSRVQAQHADTVDCSTSIRSPSANAFRPAFEDA